MALHVESVSGNEQNMCENRKFKDKFNAKLTNFYESQCGSLKKPWTNDRVLEVISHIKTGILAMEAGVRRIPAQYYWSTKYDVMTVDSQDYLILKKNNSEDSPIRVIPTEQYFDLLLEIHKEIGHGGRDKMLFRIKDRYYIQKKAIEIFVSLCPTCEKKRHLPKKNMINKPIVPKDFNTRGQIDLIDFHSTPDGDFKWLLNYQDHASKFIQLRPLRTNQASEIALELVKIFLVFGAPLVLQGDNDRKFNAKIIEEIVKMWPECKIVHGSSRHPQTQGSIDRNNQNVKNMLHTWMYDNNSTSWSIGCNFVQYQKNISYQKIMGKSPYRALFGCDPKYELQISNFDENILTSINTEEELEQISHVQTSDNGITNKQTVNYTSENPM